MNRRNFLKYAGVVPAALIAPTSAFANRYNLNDLAAGLRSFFESLMENREIEDELYDAAKEEFQEKVEPRFDKDLGKDVHEFDLKKELTEKIKLGSSTGKLKKDVDVHIAGFQKENSLTWIVSATKDITKTKKEKYPSIGEFYYQNPKVIGHSSILLLPEGTIIGEVEQRSLQKRGKYIRGGKEFEVETSWVKLDPISNLEQLILGAASVGFERGLQKLNPVAKKIFDNYIAWQERKSKREVEKLKEKLNQGSIFSVPVFPEDLSDFFKYSANSEIARLYRVEIENITTNNETGILLIPYPGAKIQSQQALSEMMGQSTKIFATSFGIKEHENIIYKTPQEVMEANFKFTKNEDIKGLSSTIHPESPIYISNRHSMKKVFDIYDLDFNIENIDYIKINDNEVKVNFVQSTRKISGPEFRNNRVIGTHYLRKYKESWKIHSTEIRKVELLR